MKVVLDTSVVIGPPPGDLGDEVAISAVSLAQLHFGVLVARDEDERAARLGRLVALEREFEPLPVDAAVSAAYGRLAAALAVRGRQPRSRSMDLLIAATAVANDASLATRNPTALAGLEALVDIVAV